MLRLRLSICIVLTTCFLVGNSTAGEIDPSQSQWLAKYQKQENAPDPAKQLLNTDPEPDVTEGFTPMFNGKDLSGWTAKGGTCQFEVKDGKVVGTCVEGSDSTYLCTDKADYENFVFSCDIRWLVEGNTGVMFRAQVKPGKDDKETVFGPQAEMEEASKGRGWSGGIYGQSCGGYFYPCWLKEHADARAAQKKDDWNRLTISAEGNVMKTWLNGVPIANHVDDGTYAKGFFGLQIHKGQEGTVLFRNVRVKELAK